MLIICLHVYGSLDYNRKEEKEIKGQSLWA